MWSAFLTTTALVFFLYCWEFWQARWEIPRREVKPLCLIPFQSIGNRWKQTFPGHKKKMCFPRGLNTKQAGPRVLIFGLTKGGDRELWTFRENQRAENSLFLSVSYPTIKNTSHLLCCCISLCVIKRHFHTWLSVKGRGLVCFLLKSALLDDEQICQKILG